MCSIFFNEKELRLIIDLLIKEDQRDLANNIKEQIFKRDLTEEEKC